MRSSRRPSSKRHRSVGAHSSTHCPVIRSYKMPKPAEMCACARAEKLPPSGFEEAIISRFFGEVVESSPVTSTGVRRPTDIDKLTARQAAGMAEAAFTSARRNHRQSTAAIDWHAAAESSLRARWHQGDFTWRRKFGRRSVPSGILSTFIRPIKLAARGRGAVGGFINACMTHDEYLRSRTSGSVHFDAASRLKMEKTKSSIAGRGTRIDHHHSAAGSEIAFGCLHAHFVDARSVMA